MGLFKRCCLSLNTDHKKISLFKVPTELNDVSDMLKVLSEAALKKFKLSKKQNLLFYANGHYLHTLSLEEIMNLENDCLVIILKEGEQLIDNKKNRNKNLHVTSENVTVVGEELIDSDAITQLKKVANLDGIIRCVGMPDLHVGQKYPIGAACESTKLYPGLVGSDIGCGVSFFETSSKFNDRDWIKFKNRLQIHDHGSELSNAPEFNHLDEATTMLIKRHNHNFGTIGSGNHFAELQKVVRLFDASVLDESKLYLLIHSGSRGLGPDILEQWEKANKTNKNYDGQYLHQHNVAVEWAKQNRKEIANLLAQRCGMELNNMLVDMCHNHVEVIVSTNEEETIYLHRKGVAPMNRGLVILPGSRGTMTYLVRPTENETLRKQFADSIAHGAGRLISRTEAAKKFKYLEKDTNAGSRLIYNHRTQINLLSEEAPGAYKNIDAIVQSLLDEHLIELVAVMEPVLTVKSS